MAGFSSSRQGEPITGINVTPLVDITLVLLIIFMVTAKLVVSQALPMDLPQAATGGQVQEVFSVTVPLAGALHIDGEAVSDDVAFVERARAAHRHNAELRVVVHADGKVSHERVMHTLDLLRQAGLARIAFAVTPRAPADSPEQAIETPEP